MIKENLFLIRRRDIFSACRAILPMYIYYNSHRNTTIIGVCILIFTVILPLQIHASQGSEVDEGPFWTHGANMLNPRTEIAAEHIDSKIYVVGGTGGNGKITDTVQIFDTKEGIWKNGAPLPFPLDHAGLSSFGGKLYLVGGFEPTPQGRHPTSTLLVYDPMLDRWDEKSPMPSARAGLSADFVDGIMYVIGGSFGDNEGQLTLNEAYDPTNDTWSKRAPMLTARHHHVSSIVDGKIYILGGRETDVSSNLDNNEMYDPQKDRWVALNPLPTGRSGLAAGMLNGSIYVLGGEKIEGSYNINEKYDPITGQWTEEKAMPTARLGLEAVTIDDKIYVIGGKESQPSESVTGRNEIFDTAVNRLNGNHSS